MKRNWGRRPSEKSLIKRYLVFAGFAVLAWRLWRMTRTRLGGPGHRKTLKTKALEGGAGLLQRLTPPQQMNVYLDGFHFESGNLGRQMEAHHYCTILNEDVTQCAIFDGRGADARLVGVEYIISEELFRALPAEEKPLWHSHQYEIKSGQLVAPGLPAWVQIELLEKMRTTYGKIWRTWDSEAYPELPLGIPKLMMGFTEDGQIHPELLAQRDRLLGISTGQNRERRGQLKDGEKAPGADAWEHGEVVQLELAHAGMTFGAPRERTESERE